LKVYDTIFVRHRPDSNAGIQLIPVEIETAHSAGIDTSSFLLQPTDKLNSLDFRRARNGTGREDGTEGVKSGCKFDVGRMDNKSPRLIVAKHSADLTGDMDDMTELFKLH